MGRWIRDWYRTVRRGFRRTDSTEHVRSVSDAEITAMVEQAIRDALGEGVSVEDAYRRVDAGELENMALASELRMLRFLQGSQPRGRVAPHYDAE